MALPKILLGDRKIILLSGFQENSRPGNAVCAVIVDSEDRLHQAAERNPEAVAFGYVAGEWIAAA
ncbi:MAG TPA: hypothetical protein VGA46_02645 [Methyloceanibacter sp.]|jgi:hypothetical protein